LKGGEAETYENVEVKYISGRKAVLTIFHDGEEQEKIELSTLKMREDMHAMFLEKGFVKKSEEEIERVRQEREREMQDEKELKEARKLEKQTAQFNKRTERQIKELDKERNETKDWKKKTKLAAEMKEKHQQMQKQQEETKKRFEQIEANIKMRKWEDAASARQDLPQNEVQSEL
jgi:hypothetical protein